jgi:hypothetical protein
LNAFSPQASRFGLAAFLLLLTGTLSSGGSLAQTASNTSPLPTSFGTYERPFSAQSYWNSRPVGITLGDFEIPDSYYRPLVGGGPYSSAAFLAKSTDQAMEVFGAPGKQGLWELDAEQFRPSITIPRWPAETVPATGSDGHADIVDPIDGVIHSFLDLKKNFNGTWTASMYAWTRLDGRGWGDPAHYFQGARAAAVPPMAGLIRKHEANDGQKMYYHALAMSLTYNALSSKTAYVFPATSADKTWNWNKGQIPEGALLMLPESFDTQAIQTESLRKVAETLKVYGAYVVDRNEGTPFYIYVENGTDFKLPNKWSKPVEQDLKRIQRSLRQVVSVKGWEDGNGKAFTPSEKLNLLSMRGPWVKASGNGQARFDSHSQSLLIEASSAKVEFQHEKANSFSRVDWAPMKPGQVYVLEVESTESVEFKLNFHSAQGQRPLYRSHWMGNGDTVEFIWPEEPSEYRMSVRKNAKDDREGRIQVRVYPKDMQFGHPLTAPGTALK